jgi:PAS domain S-box-containing protein
MSVGKGWLALRQARIHHPLSTRLIVLIVSSVLLSLLLSVWASRSLATISTQSQWLAHTERVRVQLGRVFELLLDVQNATGGYALSEDQSFLTDYREAATAIPGELDHLEELVANDPVQNALATQLESRSREYLAFADRVFREASHSNLPGARALVAGTSGPRAMNSVRSLLSQMRTEDLRELETRRATNRDALRETILSQRASVGLSIALLLCLVYFSRRDDARLRRVESELATTLSSVGDGVIATDTDGAVQFMNGIAERLTGRTAREAEGLQLEQVYRVVDSLSRSPVATPIRAVLQERRLVALGTNTVLIGSDGSERTIADTGAPILDGAGQVRGVVLVFRDVTADRVAERALQESEERYRLVTQSIHDILVAINREQRFTFWNAAAEKLTGIAAETALGKTRAELLGVTEAVTTADEKCRECMASGQPVAYELEIKSRGRTHWLDVRLQPTADGVTEISRDITERKTAEQQLRERERQFVGLANAIPNLAWTEGPDGTHQYFNRGWYEYTGLSEQQSKQLDGWRTVIHPDEEPRIASQWQQSLRTGSPFEAEFRLRRHDGHYRWFLSRASADRDAEGAIIQWFGTCTDIDATKVIEDTLRHTEAALREADTRKDVFLATLSHELRNSLAPVGAAVRLLGSAGIGAAEAARSVSILSRQVAQMASLLDDLLDISKISRGTLTLRMRPFDAREILQSAVEMAQPIIDARQQLLSIEWPGASAMLEGDPVRLTQVLANLLTNAAKYTEPGGHITLGTRSEAGHCVIFVRDTGEGLEPEMLGRVFDLYTQAAPHNEQSQAGLGIGLAMAKGLIELHGGRIEARSAGKNLGSEFTVSLPLATGTTDAIVETPTMQKEVTEMPAARRILIADDNRDGAESLALLLELSGHKVYVAHTGVESLEMACRLRPEIAVLDIGMPGLNGYEVARRIRREDWSSQILLIAVTGWGQADDKRDALAAGFDHHLTKPVDPEALEQLFAAAAPASIRTV